MACLCRGHIGHGLVSRLHEALARPAPHHFLLRAHETLPSRYKGDLGKHLADFAERDALTLRRARDLTGFERFFQRCFASHRQGWKALLDRKFAESGDEFEIAFIRQAGRPWQDTDVSAFHLNYLLVIQLADRANRLSVGE